MKKFHLILRVRRCELTCYAHVKLTGGHHRSDTIGSDTSSNSVFHSKENSNN